MSARCALSLHGHKFPPPELLRPSASICASANEHSILLCKQRFPRCAHVYPPPRVRSRRACAAFARSGPNLGLHRLNGPLSDRTKEGRVWTCRWCRSECAWLRKCAYWNAAAVGDEATQIRACPPSRPRLRTPKTCAGARSGISRSQTLYNTIRTSSARSGARLALCSIDIHVGFIIQTVRPLLMLCGG